MSIFKIDCFNGRGLFGTVSTHLSDSYVDQQDDCIYVVTDNTSRFYSEYMAMEERFGLSETQIM